MYANVLAPGTSTLSTLSVSITLCAGTTVTDLPGGNPSGALLTVQGNEGEPVSIGCTTVSSPPSCTLDGANTNDAILVVSYATVSLVGLRFVVCTSIMHLNADARAQNGRGEHAFGTTFG